MYGGERGGEHIPVGIVPLLGSGDGGLAIRSAAAGGGAAGGGAAPSAGM